ncbi:uncharacterized protein EMH_0084300 [Eimeria mitis]|uniref:Uncharacterized protein n=1 Tax=Eimeria mitis TaxID=44415 RepID=U6KBJ8_9EIME|nr:uncharacterized protein EMH_0084300 [Eimeria mitis]CDJ33622.1 hypothetical protein EMH_0084300 [Eimeria mitis]
MHLPHTRDVLQCCVCCDAEEYCCSSRAFGSWRRFGASLRSWELHLLLTRAVLVRRRKTLADPSRPGASQGGSQGPSQDAYQGLSQLSQENVDTQARLPSGDHATQQEEKQDSGGGGPSDPSAGGQATATALLEGAPAASERFLSTAETNELAGEPEDGFNGVSLSPPEGPLLSVQEVERLVEGLPWASQATGKEGFLSTTETNELAGEPEDGFNAVSLSPPEGPLLSVQEVERLVEGLPWASQATGNCDALVLPPCTRIVQLLLLHCNNKLLTAMGEGLLMRKPAYRSLLREAEKAAGDSSESSSGDSEFGLGNTPPKVVVFAHHRRVLDALVARLRELRLGCMNTAAAAPAGSRKRQGFVRIDGTVPEEERRRRRRLFLNDPAAAAPAGSRKRQGFVRIDGTVPEEERRRRRRLFLNDPTCTLALISITASSHGQFVPVGFAVGCAGSDVASDDDAAAHRLCGFQNHQRLQQQQKGGSVVCALLL